VVGIVFFWRERVLDEGIFFLRAAERRSVPFFFAADFLLRALVFLAMLRSLSLGSHRAGMTTSMACIHRVSMSGGVDALEIDESALDVD
jgi:hypothetical protein